MKYISPFTFDIWALQNPPSPNERLSKGYRIADIKASAHASHKTHACISLKQRGYSRNYGLVCNLGKQMAERQGFEPWEPRSSTVFKTAAFDHSATSPCHKTGSIRWRLDN